MGAEVLVIGEALIDIVDQGGTSTEYVGGSPANVAVGVARLGHPTDLLTRLGRDHRGARIEKHLTASGVHLAPGTWTDQPTDTARANLDAEGAATYEFQIEGSLAGADVASRRLIHTGSLALFIEPGASTVATALHAAGSSTLITLDPNIRPALVGERTDALARFRRAAAHADIVKVSDEDAQWLFPGLIAEEALAEVASYGAALTVMTRGADGVLALGPGGLSEVASWSVDVVDTIGAGDAFMASLIVSALEDEALLTDEDAVARALRRATIVAGMTVARAGANPPSRAEVEAAAPR